MLRKFNNELLKRERFKILDKYFDAYCICKKKLFHRHNLYQVLS